MSRVQAWKFCIFWEPGSEPKKIQEPKKEKEEKRGERERIEKREEESK